MEGNEVHGGRQGTAVAPVLGTRANGLLSNSY